MPGFLKLSPPAEALQEFLSALPDQDTQAETINTVNALGRITAADVRSPHPLPEFPRSTVDGYAVRAQDTFGTSESLPGYLTMVGEVPMGARSSLAVPPGGCTLIHTGGMLPEGADAVVMLEYTQIIHSGEVDPALTTEIELSRGVAEGENVLRVGEDVIADQVVITAGKRIGPAEIGGCMALGILKLRVAINPKIGIISSGDEVIPPEESPHPGQVRDVNSYSLGALIEKAGGQPILYGIVPDNLESMKSTAAKALAECNAVIITAGSSASARDMTAEAIGSLGAPGVLVHGVNVRPGKPTILSVCDGKAVIGLPGNPVSALVIAGLFVVPLIENLLGQTDRLPRPSVPAQLTINVPSQTGREDWVAVKLLINGKWAPGNGEVRYLAEPIFAKSNLIFSLVAANGLMRIPPDLTGVSAGEMVEVYL